jgi:hypothetical protein
VARAAASLSPSRWRDQTHSVRNSRSARATGGALETACVRVTNELPSRALGRRAQSPDARRLPRPERGARPTRRASRSAPAHAPWRLSRTRSQLRGVEFVALERRAKPPCEYAPWGHGTSRLLTGPSRTPLESTASRSGQSFRLIPGRHRRPAAAAAPSVCPQSPTLGSRCDPTETSAILHVAPHRTSVHERPRSPIGFALWRDEKALRRFSCHRSIIYMMYRRSANWQVFRRRLWRHYAVDADDLAESRRPSRTAGWPLRVATIARSMARTLAREAFTVDRSGTRPVALDADGGRCTPDGTGVLWAKGCAFSPDGLTFSRMRLPTRTRARRRPPGDGTYGASRARRSSRPAAARTAWRQQGRLPVGGPGTRTSGGRITPEWRSRRRDPPADADFVPEPVLRERGPSRPFITTADNPARPRSPRRAVCHPCAGGRCRRGHGHRLIGLTARPARQVDKEIGPASVRLRGPCTRPVSGGR